MGRIHWEFSDKMKHKVWRRVKQGQIKDDKEVIMLRLLAWAWAMLGWGDRD